MKACTIIIDDEVNCRIGGLRDEHAKVLYDKFGIHVDGYFHMPLYQLRKWDGKTHYFDKNGKTYTKLLDQIVPYLCTWDYDIKIDDRRVAAPIINDRIDDTFFGLEHFLLRPYQVEVVNKLLEEGSGFAICATGAGKTSMCAALSLMLYLNGLQTLIIVPSSDLVTQTVLEFRDRLQFYPITIGEYSGSQKDIDHPIVVATWQSLQNVPHYMSYFQAFIVDEAHGAKAEVIKKLVNENGKHISHRYGVTGTFPKSEADQMTLKMTIGKIHIEIPAAWLIEQGYLSRVDIEPIETHDVPNKEDEKDGMPDYSSERSYISSCDERIEVIAQLIEQCRDEYGNTMVLVNSIPQGRDLQSRIPGSVFLDGGAKKEVRQENYAQYAERDGMIVIATSGIASTGLSIDRIFCLILIDAGKSFVKCIQSVGRGLRKKGDKSYVRVIDVHSKLKFSKKHFKERKRFYSEAGYPMLPPKKLKY